MVEIDDVQNFNIQIGVTPGVYSDFTLLPGDGGVTLTPERVTVEMFARNNPACVYKDCGAGAFAHNFTHEFIVQATWPDLSVPYEELLGTYIPYGLSNDPLITYQNIYNPPVGEPLPGICVGVHPQDIDVFRFFLRDGADGRAYIDLDSDPYLNTKFYCTVVRDATSTTLWVYTDPAKTILAVPKINAIPEDQTYNPTSVPSTTDVFSIIHALLPRGDASVNQGRMMSGYTEGLVY